MERPAAADPAAAAASPPSPGRLAVLPPRRPPPRPAAAGAGRPRPRGALPRPLPAAGGDLGGAVLHGRRGLAISFSVNRIYLATFPDEAQLAAFLGLLVAANSLFALALQTLLTNRLLLRFGAKVGNLVFPLTTLVAGLLLALAPGLATAVLGSLNKDTLLPAFRTPVTSLFYNALPAQLQGRSRALSLILVMPLALLCCGGLLLAALQAPGSLLVDAIGVVAAALFLVLCVVMNRCYVSSIVGTLEEKICLREPSAHETAEQRAALLRLSREVDEEVLFELSRGLLRNDPQTLVDTILPRMEQAPSKPVDQLLRMLARQPSAALDAFLSRRLDGQADRHLQATIVMLMADRGHPEAPRRMRDSLASSHPRLRAAGAYAAARSAAAEDLETARTALAALLDSPRVDDRLAALEVLRYLEEHAYEPRLASLLDGELRLQQRRVLQVLDGWSAVTEPGLQQRLGGLLQQDDPELRQLAVACLRHLPDGERRGFATALLVDDDARVRHQAVALLVAELNAPAATLAQWLTTNDMPTRALEPLLESFLARQPEIALAGQVTAYLLEQAAAFRAAERALSRA
ncbi:MAG TPA: hypothetical protein VIX81_10935, partial [Gammaproteobacteria bacterium]